MKIKFLARPLDWLERKYIAKLGNDWYIHIDEEEQHTSGLDSRDMYLLRETKKDRYMSFIYITEMYLRNKYPSVHADYYKNSNKFLNRGEDDLNTWFKNQLNSSDLKLKRIAFVWTGMMLRNKISSEFTDGEEFFLSNKNKYYKLSLGDRKKLLMGILSELADMKYISHATKRGKYKMQKFFESMRLPFASYLETWYNKDNQRELFNPAIHYPIEQEDWWKYGYKSQKEYEESYDDDYCGYCWCSC